MTYQLPQLLPHCQVPKQQFCSSCRKKEGGRAFRQGVLERQGITDVHVDFECPLNKPWIEEQDQSIQNNHWNNIEISDPIDDRYKNIIFQNISIKDNSQVVSWKEGDVLNNIEYKLSKSLGDPNTWMIVLRDAAEYYDKDLKTSFPLDLYISLEDSGTEINLEVSLLDNKYGYEKIIFKDQKQSSPKGKKEFKYEKATAYFSG